MTKIYMISGAVVILLVAIWAYGASRYNRGVADTEAAQITATAEILTRAEAAASKSRMDIAALKAKYERITNAERAKLNELLKINTELADWFLTHVPDAAVEFIFNGVPAEGGTDSSTVPGADGDSGLGDTKQARVVIH